MGGICEGAASPDWAVGELTLLRALKDEEKTAARLIFDYTLKGDLRKYEGSAYVFGWQLLAALLPSATGDERRSVMRSLIRESPYTALSALEDGLRIGNTNEYVHVPVYAEDLLPFLQSENQTIRRRARVLFGKVADAAQTAQMGQAPGAQHPTR